MKAQSKTPFPLGLSSQKTNVQIEWGKQRGNSVSPTFLLKDTFTAAALGRWFIQFHESTISNVVSSFAGVQSTSASSLSYSKMAVPWDE